MTFLERVVLWTMAVYFIVGFFLRTSPETAAANLRSWIEAVFGA